MKTTKSNISKSFSINPIIIIEIRVFSSVDFSDLRNIGANDQLVVSKPNKLLALSILTFPDRRIQSTPFFPLLEEIVLKRVSYYFAFAKSSC